MLWCVAHVSCGAYPYVRRHGVCHRFTLHLPYGLLLGATKLGVAARMCAHHQVSYFLPRIALREG